MLYEELDDRFGRRKKRTVIFGMAGGTPPTPPTPPTPSVLEEKALNFYDFEGTLVASYDADEIAGLTELPEPPDHSADEVPLTFEEWNWTLAEIKEYHTELPENKIDVGATYHPTDGKSHAIFNIENDNDTNGVQIAMGAGTIEWGDGLSDSPTASSLKLVTHVYARKGRYHCIIDSNITPVSTTTNKAFQNSRTLCKLEEFYMASKPEHSSMSEKAFAFCHTLKRITIPSSLATLGKSALTTCESLQFIVLPKSITTLAEDSFTYCRALKKILLPETLVTIGDYSLSYIRKLEIPTFPRKLERINDHAFDGGSLIGDLILPRGLESLGRGAFQECFLSTVELNGPVAMTDRVFASNPNLKKISIPEGVTRIPANACLSCYSLQKVELPSSITEIGNYAFNSIGALSVIYVKATTPPTLGSSAIPSVIEIQKIYVPAESVEAYKSATNWADYAEKIEAIPA